MKKLIYLILLIFPSLLLSSEPLTPDEIASLIDSEAYYSGLAVIELVQELQAAALEELEKTSAAAVEAATEPLINEIHRINNELFIWQTGCGILGGSTILAIILILIQ